MARLGFIDRAGLLSWADSIGSRSDLPRLIRRLILETGRGISELSFAAGEGVGLGDWDGVTRADEPTTFIPGGISGWELSVEKNPGSKADKDYAKRTAAPNGLPTTECTYVAVSLRPWPKRNEWATERSAERKWRSVQALGLDQIETWLEAAPVTWAWISELRGLGPHGLRPVDRWWDDWSSATRPALPPDLLLAGRGDQVEALRLRLADKPQITTIRASSRDEVIAFVAAFELAQEKAGNPALIARSAIVDDVATWRSLQLGTGPLVLVAKTEAIAAEAGGASTHHVVIPLVGPGSADIKLPPLDHDAASVLLKATLGPTREQEAEDIARLARTSLLAARRRLATKPELHRPIWSRSPIDRAARRVLLANRWNDRNDADKLIVARLAGKPYSDFADDVARYASGEDPLVARIDDAVSVVYPYDAWLLIRQGVSAEDLTEFRTVVLAVLGAQNPALELPIEEQWLAAIRGKSRPHSKDLREGLVASLALLGTLGVAIPGATKSGSDVAREIVWELLKAANEDDSATLWRSLDDVLPELAEATPNEFLNAVAKGLEGETPLLLKVFVDSKDAGFFGRSTHTGLLWGLEVCAWSPTHLGQATDLLARLAEIDPGGRMANRPFNSLREIFLPWHPGNSVDPKRRLDVIDGLRKRHPKISWGLMMALLPQGMDASHMTYEPRYRDWKPAEAPVLMRDYWSFVEGLIDRLLEDAGEDASRWPELIEKLDDVPEDMRGRLLDRLKVMAGNEKLSETERGRIWEELRGLVGKHREFPDAVWVLPAAQIEAIAAVAELFVPTAPLILHAWLFADYMPSIDGSRRRVDRENYDAELTRLRAEAMKEIAAVATWEEIVQFARRAKQPFAVGIAMSVARLTQFEPQLVKLIDSDDPAEYEFARAYCIHRAINDPDWLDSVLSGSVFTPRHHARLLLCAQDLPKAWAAADAAGQDVAKAYWLSYPRFPSRDEGELVVIAERLIGVGRVAASLDLMAMGIPKDPNERLAALIVSALRRFVNQAEGDKEVVPAEYDYQRLFEYLDNSPTVTQKDIAELEWIYLAALEHTGRKFKLHQAMSETPDLFIDMITRAFKPRNAKGERTEADSDKDEEPDAAAANVAMNAYRLLGSWKVVPGTKPDGLIDPEKLRGWVHEARARLSALDRREIGDDQIGKVFAWSPPDADDTWPALPVRDLVEEIQSSELETGLRTQIRNKRGVWSRGLESGGTQERQLAERFSKQAAALADRWPRTAEVLRSVSEAYAREAVEEDEGAERYRKGLEGRGAGRPTPETERLPPSDGLLHFAYGSNMSTKRLESRLKSVVRKRGVGKLGEYRIRFDKKSDDGSGKTNIVPTAGDAVWGVLLDLTPAQYKALAKQEKGYKEQGFTIQLGSADVQAKAFVAQKTVGNLRPTRIYLNYLIAGAREHQLPTDYIKMLESVEVAPAPKPKRTK